MGVTFKEAIEKFIEIVVNTSNRYQAVTDEYGLFSEEFASLAKAIKSDVASEEHRITTSCDKISLKDERKEVLEVIREKYLNKYILSELYNRISIDINAMSFIRGGDYCFSFDSRSLIYGKAIFLVYKMPESETDMSKIYNLSQYKKVTGISENVGATMSIMSRKKLDDDPNISLFEFDNFADFMKKVKEQCDEDLYYAFVTYLSLTLTHKELIANIVTE